MEKWKNYVVSGILMCISRFPFWEALSTIMLLGEIETKTNRNLRVSTYYVYVDAAILILCGTFMSFQASARRSASIIAAVHLVIRTFVQFHLHQLKSEVLVHILLRNAGVVASYFLLASGVGTTKAKHRSLVSVSSFVIAIMFAVMTVSLWTSDFEQTFIKNALPRQVQKKISLNLLYTILGVCMGACALLFTSHGKGGVQARRFALIFWLLMICPSDFAFSRMKTHIEVWSHLRLMASSFCTLGTIVVLNCFK